jgi:hypothetical protein
MGKEVSFTLSTPDLADLLFSSLSFAIAGISGLDIYCISPLEPTLTEEDLGPF